MIKFSGSDGEKQFIDWLTSQIDEGIKSQEDKSLQFWSIRAGQAKEETNSYILGCFIYCNSDYDKFIKKIKKMGSMAKNKSDQASDQFLGYIYDQEWKSYEESLKMFEAIFPA